jgi:hypothetical protein
MGRGQPTEADIWLAEHLSDALGRSISPRQTERWREAGLLPELPRRSLGRGRGSTPGMYDESVIRHAVTVARAVAETRRLSEAAIVSFVRGYSPRENALRRSYAAEFDALLRLMASEEHEDQIDASERLAQRMSRRSGTSPRLDAMRGRLHQAGEATAFTQMLTNMLAVSLGTGAALQPRAFEALGLPTPEDAVPIQVPDLHTLREVTQTADLGALERARSRFTALRDVAAAIASSAGADALGLSAIGDVLADDGLVGLIVIPALVWIERERWSEAAIATFAALAEVSQSLREQEVTTL